nr:hypothetical protein CFP56_02574 [Quercus suber]
MYVIYWLFASIHLGALQLSRLLFITGWRTIKSYGPWERRARRHTGLWVTSTVWRARGHLHSYQTSEVEDYHGGDYGSGWFSSRGSICDSER